MQYYQQLAIDAAASKAVFIMFFWLSIGLGVSLAITLILYFGERAKVKILRNREHAQRKRTRVELEDRDNRIAKLQVDIGDVEFLKDQYRKADADLEQAKNAAIKYRSQRDKSDAKLAELTNQIAKVTEHVQI